MEITKSQADEWYSHPVTKCFVELIEQKKASFQESSRYTAIGSNRQPMSVDACALNNAHIEGLIVAFEEVKILARNLAEEKQYEN